MEQSFRQLRQCFEINMPAAEPRDRMGGNPYRAARFDFDALLLLCTDNAIGASLGALPPDYVTALRPWRSA
jgi:hypothetical protein